MDDDQYPAYRTKVFLDSNIVLEGLPLGDLPWNEIDPAGPILILLTPRLLQEVDSKKRDGRLGNRAREFNRLVAPLATTNQPIRLLDGPPQVDIGAARCGHIDWDAYDDLDPSQGDARNVAEVLHVLGVPMEHRVLVSQDVNPLFMAQRYGIEPKHVSDAWLLPAQMSSFEKEKE